MRLVGIARETENPVKVDPEDVTIIVFYDRCIPHFNVRRPGITNESGEQATFLIPG
jgi:hypothetical protein